ncbi:hypothetical protein [Streptomyces sp. NPDC018352]|uniref:hypothetical protein n=1 Tax=Streptomyces sp. NPDC018352 TaxID=3157194 RepID=UPI0034108EB6
MPASPTAHNGHLRSTPETGGRRGERTYDFYYAEIEMRRHDRHHTTRAERGLLRVVVNSVIFRSPNQNLTTVGA